ncbi:MAG: sce7726 family protein [Lachnospiraceae bacterium]|nr:sce7726 family protein [Lachnospiraceae bacterium]
MLYDKDIREPLFEFLEENFGKIRILEEKVTGGARADVLMIMPDKLCGIEIKSDADSYARLEKQVKNYDLYYDCNMVAVGSKHASHIGEHVPEHWGIITIDEADGKADFYILRPWKENPRRSLENKLSILWRPELAHIQELNRMHAYKRMSKDFVRNKILEKVDPEILNKQICDELFERDYNTIAERINEYRKSMSQKPRRKKRKTKYLKGIKAAE